MWYFLDKRFYLTHLSMKKISIILITLAMIFSSCEKKEKITPACITDKINNYGFCETGASVTQYLFQGEILFVFNPGNCGSDMTADIYNESCISIGYLGGNAGNNIVNGVLFTKVAKFQKTIWSN
jgi:hypothetical protein